MKLFTDKKKRKIFIIVTSIVLALAILIAACAIYLNDYYRAYMGAIEAFLPIDAEWKEHSDGTIVFGDKYAETGFIFYPGGKVEYTAYIPLMHELSERGFFCVLVEMPFNLAVFDVNAADGIQKKYPEIKKWYIGGHSLGGAMAASYLSEHKRAFDGLVLLAAYSSDDLSKTDLEVLSVFGSNDRVMNRQKYKKNKSNLPSDFTEVVIDGGNHAYFGMYGHQDGDGKATISNEEQIELTADAIADFFDSDQ